MRIGPRPLSFQRLSNKAKDLRACITKRAVENGRKGSMSLCSWSTSHSGGPNSPCSPSGSVNGLFAWVPRGTPATCTHDPAQVPLSAIAYYRLTPPPSEVGGLGLALGSIQCVLRCDENPSSRPLVQYLLRKENVAGPCYCLVLVCGCLHWVSAMCLFAANNTGASQVLVLVTGKCEVCTAWLMHFECWRRQLGEVLVSVRRSHKTKVSTVASRSYSVLCTV